MELALSFQFVADSPQLKSRWVMVSVVSLQLLLILLPNFPL